MPKPKAPPTTILPQEWKNPVVRAVAPSKPVLPEPQREPPIPLKPIVVPETDPTIYVPVEQPPIEQPSEPAEPPPMPPPLPPMPPMPPLVPPMPPPLPSR